MEAIRSTIEVEILMYNAIKDYLQGVIKGKLYQSECRPQDSRKEDAIVKVPSMVGDEIQDGIADIDIYVQDIANGTGHNVPNKKRLYTLIEETADNIINLLNTGCENFEFRWNNAPRIFEEEATHEHFINYNIRFRTIKFTNL